MRKLMITAALLSLGGTAAVAQDEYGQEDYSAGQATEMSVSDTFAAMDSDLDGAVTEAEFVAYAGEGSESQFAAAAGDDGVLTEDELTTFVGAPEDGMGDE